MLSNTLFITDMRNKIFVTDCSCLAKVSLLISYRVNGNLSKKLPFEGFTPYQNYEDIVCFSQRRITLRHSIVPSTDENGFDVFGCMKGMISRLNYFNYALCYAEIQQLMNQGPSNKMDSTTTNQNIPPYLDDTWWSQGY